MFFVAGHVSFGVTEILYFPSAEACYLREFDARVVERGPDYVVLDRTLFYAEGGGQPYDTGALRWDGGEARIHRVTKEKGVVKHFADRLPERDEVHGIVDWDRRYAHMRYHTSQHLMSGIVWSIYSARTVGNQLYADRARVDFQPANFAPEDLKRIEDECNRAIDEALSVQIYEEERVKIENEIGDRSLVDLIPKHITRLRVVKVGNRDYCPCGGTHLRNTSEIGRVRILERRSKGRETDRLSYTLTPPPEA